MADDKEGNAPKKDAGNAQDKSPAKSPIERAAGANTSADTATKKTVPMSKRKTANTPEKKDASIEASETAPDVTPSPEPQAPISSKPKKSGSGRFAWLLVFLLVFFIGGVAATPYLLPQAMPYLPEQAKAYFQPLMAQGQSGSDLTDVTAKLNQLDANLKDVRQMASAAQSELRALPAPAPAPAPENATEMAVDTAQMDAFSNRINGLAQQLEQLSGAQAGQADAYARLQTSLEEMPVGEGGGVSPAVVATLRSGLADGESARTALAATIEDLSGQLETLSAAANTPAPDTASAQALSDVATALRERLTRLEERLDVVANAANSAAAPEALASVNNDVTSALGDFSARLQALENVRQQATAAMVAGLESARLAQAVSNGRAYAAELKALTQLKAQAGPALPDIGDLLQEIAPFADSGIPSGATLSAQLEERAREILTAIDTPEGANWWERLLARLRNLVVVRSVDADTQGATPPDVLARAEVAARAGEWGRVVIEIDALPEAAKQSLGAWWGYAQARANAQRTLADLGARLGVAAAQSPSAGMGGAAQ